ncbi:hypothetical protein AVEN_27948-1 [Araneus ventricosus]|uniref:Uncharacterized protein n=1 Tax=Araneus ventricosus TaxID=182803 RepID=A0A4Y2R6G2_ARAVE|nr:hypothetical protein AVEN_27948-1 [Araneus ventricosus]
MLVQCRLWVRKVQGSKPDSSEDQSCMWARCTLNHPSWVKQPPAGVMRNLLAVLICLRDSSASAEEKIPIVNLRWFYTSCDAVRPQENIGVVRN